MLGRLSALLLGLFLTISNNVNAEPMVMPVLLICDSESGEIINMTQEEYGEIPFFQGQGVFQTQNGQWNTAIILSTVNPDTRTYSIIMVDPISGAECILLVGSQFAPATTQ